MPRSSPGLCIKFSCLVSLVSFHLQHSLSFLNFDLFFFLKTIDLVFCRMSFSLGLPNISLWLDSNYAFLARYHKSAVVSLSGSSPGGSLVKNAPANAGVSDSIPGLGRSSGEGNGNRYSCLGSPIDRGDWRAIVHGLQKSWTQFSN